MKIIRVVAAVICDSIQTKHKIYATARGYGDYKGQWEFPGGKIEPGETPQQALKREIKEELDTEIAVLDKIGTIEYDYPAFHLSMDCFWCEVLSGDLVLKEAEAARWLTKDELGSVHWLPADHSRTDSSDIGMKSIVQIFIVAILQKLPICCMGINYTFKLKIGSLLYSTATEALRYSIHNIYH